MQQATMRVGDHAYVLAPGQDIDDLKRRSGTAVRDGGDLVTFALLGNGEVAVMITGGTSVVFSRHDAPSTSTTAEMGTLLPSYDFD